jgi:hypothetical protein
MKSPLRDGPPLAAGLIGSVEVVYFVFKNEVWIMI